MEINQNTEHYYNSAKAFFLPVKIMPEMGAIEIKLGKKRYFFKGITPFNPEAHAEIIANKFYANQLLSQFGFPVPKAVMIERSEFESGLFEHKLSDVSFPVVLKPTEGTSLGNDVLCNLKNMEQLKQFMAKLFTQYKLLSIEAFHEALNSYRVLIFRKKVIAVVLRYPAQVIGDGENHLQALIDQTNRERKALRDFLAPIVVDEECKIRLDELNIDLSYIPEIGEKITLGYTTNASRGGSLVSVDKKICKENRRLMARIAEALSVDFVGIDILCHDLMVPIEEDEWVIIEANTGPSIRIHEEPIDGARNHVTRKIIRHLIYRHPFAYLAILYQDERTEIYMKTGLFLLFFGLAYLYFF